MGLVRHAVASSSSRHRSRSRWCNNFRVGERDDREILQEQIEYYRARANEYDDWFFRIGRYDRGEVATRRWFEQVDEVREALRDLPIDDKSVLELAPGTGVWTEQVCSRAARLTAVDSSSEMIALNRERLGARARNVTYVEADLFDWTSDQVFDAVIFCFWISHIPTHRLDHFLAKVAKMLVSGGAIFFVDARREISSTAIDHVLPEADEEVMIRRLDDGREYSIIKNFWDPEFLELRCRLAGLDVRIRETADYFQMGVGTRS